MDIIAELTELEGHEIYVSTELQTIGSDEWEFSFYIQWIPPEAQTLKRRAGEFKYYKSFSCFPPTYDGAWTTQAQALEEGIKYAKENILPKLNLKR